MNETAHFEIDDATAPTPEHPFFAAAGDELAREIARRFPLREVRPSARVAQAAAPVDGLGILLSGTVRAFQTVPDGRTLLHRLLRAPALVGLAEVLCGEPSPYTYEALEPCTLVFIETPALRDLLERSPALSRLCLHHLGTLATLDARNEAAVLAPMEARVANVLLAYAEAFGRTTDEGGALTIEHPVSHPVIADAVGAVWRSVGRAMSCLQRRGLVAKRDGHYLLTRPAALAEVAGPIRGGLFHRMDAHRPLPRRPRKPPSGELRLVRGPLAKRPPFVVEEELLIGRRAPAGLKLPDETVCPLHCRIARSRTGGRFWIEDLGSLNGTLVNGQAVRRALLHDQDRIELGRSKIVFRLVAADGAAEHGALASEMTGSPSDPRLPPG